MKRHLMHLTLPLVSLALSSCCNAERMIFLMDDSTAKIHANREAIERSTNAIRKNQALVEGSSKTLEENYNLLEKVKKS